MATRGYGRKPLVGTGGKVIVEREKTDQGSDEGQKGRKAFHGSKNFYHRSSEVERPA